MWLLSKKKLDYGYYYGYFLVWKRDGLLSCSCIGVEMSVPSYAQTGQKGISVTVSVVSDAHGCVKCLQNLFCYAKPCVQGDLRPGSGLVPVSVK